MDNPLSYFLLGLLGGAILAFGVLMGIMWHRLQVGLKTLAGKFQALVDGLKRGTREQDKD